jgi:lipopolysaccharide export system protein LptC
MFRHPMSWIGLALVIIVLVFWDRSPTQRLQPTAEDDPQFPNAYIENMETRVFNAQGRLHYRLTARRADHFQVDPISPGEDDYSLVERPDLTMYPETAAPWHLKAEMGRSDARGEVVLLYDGVRAWQDGAHGLTELVTSELWLEVPQEYAHTDKAVNMRAEQGTTDAIGMRALLGEERIELLSEVQGLYRPQASSRD